MSKSALANITAQYTDSENDEQQFSDSDSDNSQSSQVIIPTNNKINVSNASEPKTPEKPPGNAINEKKKKKKKRVRRLVSYQDDTIISDEEERAEGSETSSGSEDDDDESDQEANGNDSKQNTSVMDVDNETVELSQEARALNRSEKLSKYAHYGFTLPPEPKGKPSQELVDKIRDLYEKMGTNNIDMNRIIQGRKEFRNPSIYDKLIQFCDINEFGTNYPPEMYDPLQWGPESYYEELARVQKSEMAKREKNRKDTDKIEQVNALARKVEEAKKRKSKWDQPAPGIKSVQTALTTTITGTKGTVISAFGSLPKKPAP